MPKVFSEKGPWFLGHVAPVGWGTPPSPKRVPRGGRERPQPRPLTTLTPTHPHPFRNGILANGINGLVVTKLRIPAFIATLGLVKIHLAPAFMWDLGHPVSDPTFNALGIGTQLRVLPIPLLW
jgi:hypothetical protein